MAHFLPDFYSDDLEFDMPLEMASSSFQNLSANDQGQSSGKKSVEAGESGNAFEYLTDKIRNRNVIFFCFLNRQMKGGGAFNKVKKSGQISTTASFEKKNSSIKKMVAAQWQNTRPRNYYGEGWNPARCWAFPKQVPHC